MSEQARRGYEGYAKSTGGKTFDGRDMPTWDELPARIQAAGLVKSGKESELALFDRAYISTRFT